MEVAVLTAELGVVPHPVEEAPLQAHALAVVVVVLRRQPLEELHLRERQADADIQVIMPPTIACFRMTRRLVGTFSLGERHAHTWFDDTLGLTSDWRKPGPVYAIPFRSICGR